MYPNYGNLVVWMNDGKKVSYGLKECPKTMFHDDNIVISAGGETSTYPVSQVQKFTYDGISAASTSESSRSMNGIAESTRSEKEDGIYVYQKNDSISVFSRSEVDSIIYVNKAKTMYQETWTEKVTYGIDLSKIDSVGFVRPFNMLLSIPKQYLEGWDFGYIHGDECFLGHYENNGNVTVLINKKGVETEKGLILVFNDKEEVINVGSAYNLFDVKYTDNNIVLFRINNDGLYEEETISIKNNAAKTISIRARLDTAFSLIVKGTEFIDNINSANSINNDLLNWDWGTFVKEVSSSGAGVVVGNALGGVDGFVNTVSYSVIDSAIQGKYNHTCLALYNKCEISIDEIKNENGQCVVYARVKNADSLHDYLLSVSEPTPNEETRNYVFCGIAVRKHNEYVTRHMCDYLSQEVLLNGNNSRNGSELSLSFTMPEVKLEDLHATLYFRPYLKSTRLIKKKSGDVNEGFLKYGETVPCNSGVGEIKKLITVFAINDGSGKIQFQNVVEASVHPEDGMSEWGVYVDKLETIKKYELHPSRNHTLHEDAIRIDLDINKSDFDEIINTECYAKKNIKLGVYIEKTLPDGSVSYYYSEPQKYDLVYEAEPVVTTGKTYYINESSAKIEGDFSYYKFWGGIAGMEITGNGKTTRLIGDFKEEGENVLVVKDLIQDVNYKYRAFVELNGKRKYGEYKNLSGLWVNLGLSVKWAACNVGASSPEGYGDFFAWGEISPKDSYDGDNYAYGYFDMYGQFHGQNLGEISGNRAYDAARANWGAPARMPTKAEFAELIERCTWQWTTSDGDKGMLVTGPNGNSIFLPAAGSQNGHSRYRMSERGFYWSSTPDEYDDGFVHCLNFGAGSHYGGKYSRYCGLPVRPVSN